VRFSVRETVPECYEDLRAQWWGNPKSLHLDCWGEVEQVEGFDVFIDDGPPRTTERRLFFVNLGGYDPDQFAELHRNVLIVAPDEAIAKARALSTTGGWNQPHKDRLLEVENMLDIGKTVERTGRFVRLVKAETYKTFRFECGYTPIG
jgi:hypothetical protein